MGEINRVLATTVDMKSQAWQKTQDVTSKYQRHKKNCAR